MKSIAKMTAALTVMITAAVVMAGCGSFKPGQGPGRVKGTAVPVALEHKGSGLGINDIPEWVALSMNGTAADVEGMDVFKKKKYCIIANEMGPEIQPLLTWVNRFNAQQELASVIDGRIKSTFQAYEGKAPQNDKSQRAYENVLTQTVVSDFSGLRKEADWWIKQEVRELGGKPYIRYVAYVLYTIDKENLDRLVTAKMEEILSGDPEMKEFSDAVSEGILVNGLAWKDNLVAANQ